MSKNINTLAAFQHALDLAAVVHNLTRRFPREELFGLVSQMRRASYSICSNIAEGQGRLTYGERRQFLSQARGSLYEVEAQLMIALRLGFIQDCDFAPVRTQIRKCAGALAGYIRWVQTQERRRNPGNLTIREPD